MTPHNEAAKGDYAEIVLLPGDPLRAQWIAETFFEAPRCVNRVRNCLGFTGRYKGTPVSVQATGMGQPSTAIYVHELLDIYGAKVLVRVGTCAGIAESVKLRDMVIALAASTNSAIHDAIFGHYAFAPCGDFELIRKAAELAEERGLGWHVGGIVSDDTFYRPEPLRNFASLIAHGVLAVEMETSTIYTLAARFRARALSICAASENLAIGGELTPAERQSSLTEMIQLALDAATTVAARPA
jgi:purine-nucleoside phosphorylase